MPVEAKQTDTLSERLPFRVKIATADELTAVARLRAAAYGKHLPALATRLLQPEAADFELGNEVFVAVSKLDGSMLGTIRTHSNLFKPLPLEASMDLPAHFQGRRLIEATRLSVLGNLQASLVRNALFKTFFHYCLSQKADWMLAAGRRPVDRLYDTMLWRDVDGVGKLYPMAHAAGVPHRVMCHGACRGRADLACGRSPAVPLCLPDRAPGPGLCGRAAPWMRWCRPSIPRAVLPTPSPRPLASPPSRTRRCGDFSAASLTPTRR